VADQSAQKHLAELVKTMEAFVAGEMSASGFDDTYRAKFSELPLGLDESTFAILETVFFACEDYVDDPDLRDPGDLDEQGLLEAARAALAALAGSL
jgi:hypothetical protein